MDKKGIELSINTIIVIILALFVLVVLFFVLQRGIIGGSNKYFNFSDTVEKDIQSSRTCAKLFSGRMCLAACDPKIMIDWGAGWDDCTGSTPTCCERT